MTNDYVGAIMTDGVLKRAHGNFTVPNDYVSGGVLTVVVIPKATGDVGNQLEFSHAANGELCNTHTASNTITYEAVVDDKVEILSNTLSFTSLATGDVVGCLFIRWGNNASDTVNAAVYCLGFIFSYTANQ